MANAWNMWSTTSATNSTLIAPSFLNATYVYDFDQRITTVTIDPKDIEGSVKVHKIEGPLDWLRDQVQEIVALGKKELLDDR